MAATRFEHRCQRVSTGTTLCGGWIRVQRAAPSPPQPVDSQSDGQAGEDGGWGGTQDRDNTQFTDVSLQQRSAAETHVYLPGIGSSPVWETPEPFWARPPAGPSSCWSPCCRAPSRLSGDVIRQTQSVCSFGQWLIVLTGVVLCSSTVVLESDYLVMEVCAGLHQLLLLLSKLTEKHKISWRFFPF